MYHLSIENHMSHKFKGERSKKKDRIVDSGTNAKKVKIDKLTESSNSSRDFKKLVEKTVEENIEGLDSKIKNIIKDVLDNENYYENFRDEGTKTILELKKVVAESLEGDKASIDDAFGRLEEIEGKLNGMHSKIYDDSKTDRLTSELSELKKVVKEQQSKIFLNNVLSLIFAGCTIPLIGFLVFRH